MEQMQLFPTSSSEEAPVKTGQWLESVLAWLEQGPDSSLNSFALLMRSLPSGFSLKTFLDSCPPALAEDATACEANSNLFPDHTEAATLPRFLERSPDSFLKSPPKAGVTVASVAAPNARPAGVCLTLNTTEWHSGAAACSLSQVLETGEIPPVYFLNQIACQGILRRARENGRKLPDQLREALERIVLG